MLPLVIFEVESAVISEDKTVDSEVVALNVVVDVKFRKEVEVARLVLTEASVVLLELIDELHIESLAVELVTIDES